MNTEPSTGFEWQCVDDPTGIALEELCEVSHSMRLDIPLERGHADVALAWAASQGVGPANPILERLALWLGGGEYARDVGLRAAVLIREFGPTARHAYNLRQIGQVFGVSKQAIHKHARHLRTSLGLVVVRSRAPTGIGPPPYRESP